MCATRFWEWWLDRAGWRSWCWTMLGSKGQRSNKRARHMYLCSFSVLPYSPHLSVKSKKRPRLTDLHFCCSCWDSVNKILLSLLALLLLQWFCSETGQRSGTQPRLHTSNTQSEQQLAGGQRLKNVYTHTHTHYRPWRISTALNIPGIQKRRCSRRTLLHLLLSRMRTGINFTSHYV